jgi:tight adherence protein B
LYKSGDFTIALTKLKSEFSHHSSDQIFEALLIAKELGGSELLQILRTLGDFLRQDLVLRREIEVKHGWIKNSAHLSAAAPWLLLLLLSTQPTTAAAYATPTGVLILASGLVMTAIAYLWMNKLGQLPQTPRVFK